MSMVKCDECEHLIDSDDDPDCFVEVGNMRRLHATKVYCEWCRESMFEANGPDDDSEDYMHPGEFL